MKKQDNQIWVEKNFRYCRVQIIFLTNKVDRQRGTVLLEAKMPSEPPSQETLVLTWITAYLHIDTALACGLQGVHPRDIGQSLLLKYQPVGSLNTESALEILSGFHSQVDFFRWHVGSGGIFGQSLESNYSILRKAIKHMLTILWGIGINLKQPYNLCIWWWFASLEDISSMYLRTTFTYTGEADIEIVISHLYIKSQLSYYWKSISH